LTRIVPGKFKGVGFKKGHVVQPEDLPELLKIGKQYIFVLELSAGRLHEDDAARRIAHAICGDALTFTEPSEGKINIVTTYAGLLKIDARRLLRINKMRDIIVSTLKTNFPCAAGQLVAATRIIPLTIASRKIERLEQIAAPGPAVIQVLPYRPLKVGAIITGTEIYEGLIPDGFDSQVKGIVNRFGADVIRKILTPDDPAAIADAVRNLIDLGCDLLITTGGLSVDPDDVTRKGIVKAGARMIVYGAPVLPGAMFLYARLQDVPILGLPACVYYHGTTIFNLVLPRILAGEDLTPNDVAALGHGGLCLNCETCRFPVCPYGK
jgi:molybdopterin biosynthesis enzyme